MVKFIDFLHKTFQDPRGTPDAKLLTTFAFVVLILLSIPYGLMTGKWMPEYAFSNIMLLIGAGLGLSSFEIKAAITSNPGSTDTPAQIKEDIRADIREDALVDKVIENTGEIAIIKESDNTSETTIIKEAS